MNFQTYEIKGRHTNTNRMRTIKVEAFSEEDAVKIALEKGIVDIQSKIFTKNIPTEKQLAFLEGININFSSDITKQDASVILTRYTDKDFSNPSIGLMDYATEMKIKTSMYASKINLYDTIFSSLELRDKSAFFAFSIYRHISDERESNLNNSKHREIFYKFADSISSDKSFFNSLNRYAGRHIRFFGEIETENGIFTGGSCDTVSFKSARQFLINNELIHEDAPYKNKKILTDKNVSDTLIMLPAKSKDESLVKVPESKKEQVNETSSIKPKFGEWFKAKFLKN